MKNTTRQRNGALANHVRFAQRNHDDSRNGHHKGAILITGGAGFIGTNLAHRLLSEGTPVILYDNLSRPNVEHNLAWLKSEHGQLVRFEHGDVLDFEALRKVVRSASKVFHFAAQVAVTTSLDEPIKDFEINARGTLNLLEALRGCAEPPPLLFTSTNKVYGDLKDVELEVRDGRYEPTDAPLRRHGFSEERALAFHSPYGCSKGAACQYVLDYARTFGMRTIVFRMSCIYGLHQFGNEDQGWVAHFLIRALKGLPITIYGDGRQVRDILFVEDLVEALLKAQQKVGELGGEAFNIGGGPANTISLIELLDLIEQLHGTRPETHFDDWRSADQQYYVSDTRKFSGATGWKAAVDVRTGVTKLYHWLKEFHREKASFIVPHAEFSDDNNGKVIPIHVLNGKAKNKSLVRLKIARGRTRARKGGAKASEIAGIR